MQGGGGRGGRRGAHAAEGVGHLLVQVSAFHPPLHPAAPSGRTARAPRGGRDLGAGGLRSHTVLGRHWVGVGKGSREGQSRGSRSDSKTSPTHSGNGEVSACRAERRHHSPSRQRRSHLLLGARLGVSAAFCSPALPKLGYIRRVCVCVCVCVCALARGGAGEALTIRTPTTPAPPPTRNPSASHPLP